jgi:hypothetical protein
VEREPAPVGETVEDRVEGDLLIMAKIDCEECIGKEMSLCGHFRCMHEEDQKWGKRKANYNVFLDDRED